MIAEKLPIKFNIKRLQEYFNTQVKHLEPAWNSKNFGGWSILSATGDYRDGFQPIEKFFFLDPISNKSKFDYESAQREVGYTWAREHINLTQVGTEYIAQVINTIRKAGLKPYRARWTIIPPKTFMVWHTDRPQDRYGVRLHIPIFTNPNCAFETKEGTFHMPADGSCYFVGVDCLHRAYNDGDEDRIHIIMDVIDDVGMSEHFGTNKSAKKRFHFNRWYLIRVFKKWFGLQ